MDFKKVESKWQKKWEKAKIFEANPDTEKKKFFITVPYPYVNAAPHIGNAFTSFRGDAYARFKRMQGFNVLFPQGFHATGEPILGAIERLKQGDKTQIDTFKLYGATDKDMKDFVKFGSEFTAQYWMKRWIEALKLSGYSADWRRTFITAITPAYNRFIEWQYNTLKKKGYVVQGTHPVIWCPHCQSPTGDHDRLKGEGESPIEYYMIKFKLDSGEIIPCGTLRPETVFGVTNIWINPVVEYVWCEVGREVWLLSEKAAEKLKDQLKNIRVTGKIKGEKLIGRYVENPVLKNKIVILPASFVDVNTSTGIVMSVPSHAPYDWIGLQDLQKNPEEVKRYGIDEKILKEIKPISIIKTEEFGEHAAIEVCQKMNIQSQGEKEKLDEATNLVYKKEFHLGVLKSNCKQYSGLKVAECKQKLSKEFLKKGIIDIMWETTGPVVCRCNTQNHVKILENQWFLKFSDERWKQKVKDCISQMKFYPEEARTQFLNTVDWLEDKACARKAGLGTKLPWDRGWIVETLSDSTIYMAFYTISHIINEKKIKPEKLTDEIFDYVFLGKGNSRQLSKKIKLDKKIIDSLRKEFENFYPVDLRTSGKDLVQNHLTFFIFHHVAIWDDAKYWPRAIGVNGFVQVSGEKMSKRLGNIVPLIELIKKYGADIVRINLVGSNENMDDADWREENVTGLKSRLEFLDKLITDLKKAKRKTVKNIDLLLESRLQKNIEETTASYEVMKFRSGIQSAFFSFMSDLKNYVERCGGVKNCNRNILFDVLSTTVKLISPLIPHLAEEFWFKLGKRCFVSLEKWPEADERKIDKGILELEDVFRKTLEDLNQVIKLAKKRNKAYLYFVTERELEYFKENVEYIKQQFGFKEIELFLAKDTKRYDPQNKAGKAKYSKPGIYLE